MLCTRFPSAQGASWGSRCETLPSHGFLLPLNVFSPPLFCQGDLTVSHVRALREDFSFVLNESETPGKFCSQPL